MNKKYNLLILILLPVVVFTIYFFVAKNILKQEKNLATPMGMGMPDDPNSRAYYDWERHQNPETGLVPAGIKSRELAFARTLPQNTSKTITWHERGPANVGGRTRAIALDVLDENTLFVGSVSGGVWRSTDGGATYTKVTALGETHSVTSITQDTRPGKENIWYYGTGELYGIVSATSFTSRFSGNGIYKSTDNGLTWSLLTSTASNTPQTYTASGDFDFVSNIVVDHTNTNEDVVLAAVYNGVYRSIDGGNTWTSVLGHNPNPPYSTYCELEKTSTGVFYATLSSDGASAGFYRSTDGVNWTYIRPTNFPVSYQRIVMGINPSNENEVYFLGETDGYGLNDHSLWKYTYISGDGSGAGGTWENRSNNLPNGSCTGYFNFNFGPFQTQSSYDVCIVVHPTNPNTLFIGGTNIYRSTDAFTSNTNTDWVGGYTCNADPADYVYPAHHPDQHKMIFVPSTGAMLSASDGGVSICNNIDATPIVWQRLNDGYISCQFYTVSMEMGAVSNDILIGGTQDNGTWMTDDANPSTDWDYVHIDDGAYCAIPEGRNYYLVSSQQGKIYKKELDASNNVSNFERIDPTGGPTNYNFINPFILDPNDNDVLYLSARNRLYRNTDVAAIPMTGNRYNTISTNWELVPATQISGGAVGYISTLEMSKALPNTIFYGTSTAKLYRIDDLNGTPVRTNINTGIPANRYVSCIATNEFNGDELMATMSNYEVVSIYHSTDGGASWQDVSGNLEENPDGSGNGPAVYWATIYPGETYLIGTSIGLFSTDNLDGANTVWVQEGVNTIGNVVINMMKARTHDGKIAVATHGNGMYSGQLTPAFVRLKENQANAIDLNIFPNPIQDNATINFTLTESQEVSISFYDLSGKKVAGVLNTRLSAGEYNIPFARKELKAGIYLLEFNNSFVSDASIVLL